MIDDRPYVALLASDDWHPLSQYVPTKDYVYLQSCAQGATHPWTFEDGVWGTLLHPRSVMAWPCQLRDLQWIAANL